MEAFKIPKRQVLKISFLGQSQVPKVEAESLRLPGGQGLLYSTNPAHCEGDSLLKGDNE